MTVEYSTRPAMKISICIPTYNRAHHLVNCLQSICAAARNTPGDIEVCISDNGSTDGTEEVLRRMEIGIPLKYHRNQKNLGIPRNFLQVVDMAEGEFAWLVGDDDLLMPDALVRLSRLIDTHPKVDFFYVNAYHLTTEFVQSFPQPFQVDHLPAEMTPFSAWRQEGEMPFLDLIDPDISFDFLGGMFLSVFRRSQWQEHKKGLNAIALIDPRTFSHFDNTFPHVRVFSLAFPGRTAFFNVRPMIVCLTGAREWAPMYPLVRSIRLVEALDLYRAAGLPLMQYLRCRNYALSHFIPDMARILLHPKRSGLQFISLWKSILSNLLYPNLYLSPLLYLLQRFRLR
jgi:glycosyltransferase involved in cell wall biosynthesis